MYVFDVPELSPADTTYPDEPKKYQILTSGSNFNWVCKLEKSDQMKSTAISPNFRHVPLRKSKYSWIVVNKILNNLMFLNHMMRNQKFLEEVNFLAGPPVWLM